MNWTLLICEGAKAAQLLHGQSSCDLLTLPANTAVIGAFCTPKGKAYATALLHAPTADQVHILLDASLAATMEQQLQKYLPFFRCRLYTPEHVNYHYTLTQEGATKAKLSAGFFAVTHRNEMSYAITYAGHVFKYHLNHNDGGENGAQENHVAWQQHWLTTGYPILTQVQSERYTPNMLNFDMHAGVSFAKGCYTGQEAIARTYYRGQVKRRLYWATTKTQAKPTTILAAGTPCGAWLESVCVNGVWHGQAVTINTQELHMECGSEVTLRSFEYT